jgi:hypothetical protein
MFLCRGKVVDIEAVRVGRGGETLCVPMRAINCYSSIRALLRAHGYAVLSGKGRLQYLADLLYGWRRDHTVVDVEEHIPIFRLESLVNILNAGYI